MIRFATSSWTLHGTLGKPRYELDADGSTYCAIEGASNAMPLLDLPAFIAKDGINVAEITHYHLPRTDDAYLAELKEALADADVELVNLLICSGNLSSLDDASWQADMEMTRRWQDIAARLGAKGTRIDCGTEAPTPETRARSAAALKELTEYGASIGLKTTTENWRATSLQPDDVIAIMDEVGDSLELCVDFGNAAKTADKYETMKTLMPYGTSLHCKGLFEGDTLDVDEYYRCLTIAKDAGFGGHVALIYDKFDDEWGKVLRLKAEAESFFTEAGMLN